ncbi:MAG TPA: DUF3276 family protein [bacterium]|nr:DUF3276 family protein [bacterium]
MEQEVKFSKAVEAGKRRSYFFEVKEAKNGARYLTIREQTQGGEDGGEKNSRIIVFAEHFGAFISVLDEAKAEMAG